MTARAVAAEHRRQQAALAAGATKRALQWWDRLDPRDLSASWTADGVGDALLGIVGSAQLLAASTADAYLYRVLAEQGADPAADGRLRMQAFAGVASDGRNLETLLYSPVTTAKQAIGDGATLLGALSSGRMALDRIVGTQVMDLGRAAVSTATATRRAATGWVRMISPGACGRCAVLAGRWYSRSSGFLRHPACFPAGVAVNGPALAGATRRWYEGELVVLTTASGQNLPLTGNHPVLTSRGWLPANLLHEGDDVVRSTRPECATPLVVPDHQQVPALVEDIWASLAVNGFDRVPSTPEDFHGDGQYGEVDVVNANAALRNGAQAAVLQHDGELGLAGGAMPAPQFAGEGGPIALDLWRPAKAGGSVGGGDLSSTLLHGHPGVACDARLTRSAAAYSSFRQALADHVSGHAVLPCEGELTRTGFVGGEDLSVRQLADLTRWDAPGQAFTVDTSDGYACRGRDLLKRLAGQVQLDRVVEVRRVRWSGHVYSLTSVEGWHVANSLIVSNCRCVHVPAPESDGVSDIRTDPRSYFDSLTAAEQDRHFTKAGAQAIRDGADIGQVVNARRGALGLSSPGRLTSAEQRALRGGGRGRLERVDVFGRRVFVTTEGTTRRGVAGARLGQARTPRLMPESILEIATDREDAVRLLRRFGYITD